MQLYQFDYRREKIHGEPLNNFDLVAILINNDRSRIVYDVKGFLGDNKNFGINYGKEKRKGFMHEDIEYVIDSENKKISVSEPNKPTKNLFYDADKRDSFATYKIVFDSINEVIKIFTESGYNVI